MAYLDHIKACNTCDIAGFRGFWVDGLRVGWVRHALAEQLSSFPDTVTVTDNGVYLSRRYHSFESRTRAMAQMITALVARGTIPPLRCEQYPVFRSWQGEALFALDRAAVPYFGTIAYGLHVNGYLRQPDNSLHLWIATRARDRAVAPGKLDNLIAGGQPIGLSLTENLIKEAFEEAGIGPDLAQRAVPAGTVTYRLETPQGLKVDCLFVYDMEVPPDFVPRNTDGEVESFALLSSERVAEIVRETDDFKFNCNLVVIDFMIRHALIGPDHPDYIALGAGLRSWG